VRTLVKSNHNVNNSSNLGTTDTSYANRAVLQSLSSSSDCILSRDVSTKLKPVKTKTISKIKTETITKRIKTKPKSKRAITKTKAILSLVLSSYYLQYYMLLLSLNTHLTLIGKYLIEIVSRYLNFFKYREANLWHSVHKI